MAPSWCDPNVTHGRFGRSDAGHAGHRSDSGSRQHVRSPESPCTFGSRVPTPWNRSGGNAPARAREPTDESTTMDGTNQETRAEHLAQRLQARERVQIERERQASVLVPLLVDQDVPRLLLTRRTEHVGSHRGQVAFPGGFREESDPDAVATALREAWEEVALPAERVRVLGLLDDLPARSNDIRVTPVVGWIDHPVDLVPQASEVARIFTIPIPELTRRERWRHRHVERHGRTWPIYYFDHDGETLWGLSAYVTLQLLTLLGLDAPFPPVDFRSVPAPPRSSA